MKFPYAHKGVRLLIWSEALMLCAFLLRFPVLAGLDPAGWGNRAAALQRYVVPALLLAGVALQFICIQIACREGQLFRAAKWATCIRLLFTVAWFVVTCGWPSAGNKVADQLEASAMLCQLFIYYDILSGVLYIACSLADYVTLSMIERTRSILFIACGAMTLTLVMSLFVQDPRAVLALGIVILLLRAASGAIFMYVLYRVLQLEPRQSGGSEEHDRA